MANLEALDVYQQTNPFMLMFAPKYRRKKQVSTNMSELTGVEPVRRRLPSSQRNLLLLDPHFGAQTGFNKPMAVTFSVSSFMI